MAAYYTLHIAGLTRELKICPISEKLDIAAFILFSDVELTEACARELAKRVPECDYILTAESKGIPLAHEMSRQSGKPYVCARKGVKPLAEGDAAERKDLIYLEQLPLFFKD